MLTEGTLSEVYIKASVKTVSYEIYSFTFATKIKFH